jgi:elongation factor P--(R)-beta-lysine ligase
MTQWKPTATLDRLRERAALIARLRSFLAERDVLEVSTPCITACGVTDPNIDSLELTEGRGFLRTSPEYWHKRLLAAGCGDLYELGPVFRADESGRMHQVEFTLLEWYRVGWDWHRLAEEVVALIRHCLAAGAGALPASYCSWNECFRHHLNIDGLGASRQELREVATDAPGDCSRDMLLDYLFTTRIQSAFKPGTIYVVHDYPAEQAALARLSADDPRVAERFEVFLGPVELANGYGELTDAAEQSARFARDNRLRTDLGKQQMPIDTALVRALESGIPACSGVALGIDRLLMVALGADEISEVMSFPPPG